MHIRAREGYRSMLGYGASPGKLIALYKINSWPSDLAIYR